MNAAPSTGDAGDTALRFFLALVIAGEMTRLLLAGLAWAGAVSTASGPTASAVAVMTVFSSAEGPCCCCNKGCWGSYCCSPLLLQSLLLHVQVVVVVVLLLVN